MKNVKNYFLIAGVMIAMTACNPGSKESQESDGDMMETDTAMMESDQSSDMMTDSNMKSATAEISAASGSGITGTATFTETDGGQIEFELTVENATPGEHAVHIHEKGDCSAPDGKSAGGHWNPTGEKHGKRGSDAFHKGDIGNMTVADDGTGSYSVTVDDWSIGGAEDSNILEKAVIIHAGADDFTSQPSGAAGDRIGCGVIQSN